MLDTLGGKLDSLFVSSSTIHSGKLDSQMKVVENTKTHIVAEMPESKIGLLNQTKKLRVKAVMNTAGSPSKVKIYDTYKLGVKVSADFTYEDRW